MTVTVRLDHQLAVERPVEMADEAADKLCAGFRAMAKRYQLDDFPS